MPTGAGMRIDPATVKLDFGQGTTDQKLYESVVAIRTDVRTIFRVVLRSCKLTCWFVANIRGLQVFMREQGYYPEFDDLDTTSAIHFTAEVPSDIARTIDESVQGSAAYAVATARIYQLLYKPDGGPPDGPTYPLEMVFCIGRVACLKAFRGHGIGSLILEKAMSTAKRLGADRLVLHSQADKTGFYKHAGFSTVQVNGEDWCFDEDKHPHVGMQLTCDATT